MPTASVPKIERERARSPYVPPAAFTGTRALYGTVYGIPSLV
ncbi:MAG TPA: hypothetical protein VIM01_13940 [Dermatophilaceae bacterium]